MRRWLARLAGGTALYAVMVARLDAWTLVQGLAVAAGAWAVAALGEGASPHRGVPWTLLRRLPDLAGRQVLTGSWKVAAAAAGLRPLPRPGRIEVPIGERPRVRPAVLAVLETLSPGTFLIDVDEERRVMLFHLFDAADGPELRRRHAELQGLEAPSGDEDAG